MSAEVSSWMSGGVNWGSVTAVVAIVVGYGAVTLWAVRFMIEQLRKSIEKRDASRDEEVEEIYQHIDNNFNELANRIMAYTEKADELEKIFLKFQAQLPIDYVRREDWIRFGGVIDAKQDGLRELVMRILERGAKEDGG